MWKSSPPLRSRPEPPRAAPTVNPTVIFMISPTLIRRGLYSAINAVALGMTVPISIPPMKRMTSNCG